MLKSKIFKYVIITIVTVIIMLGILSITNNFAIKKSSLKAQNLIEQDLKLNTPLYSEKEAKVLEEFKEIISNNSEIKFDNIESSDDINGVALTYIKVPRINYVRYLEESVLSINSLEKNNNITNLSDSVEFNKIAESIINDIKNGDIEFEEIRTELNVTKENGKWLIVHDETFEKLFTNELNQLSTIIQLYLIIDESI